MWRERSREMRRCVSARWGAARVEMSVKASSDGVANAANVPAGAVIVGRGKSGQRALKAVPFDDWPMFIMQWCAPLRRQHAGRCASISCPIASRGATVGRPKTASNSNARTRRMCDECSRNREAVCRLVSDLRRVSGNLRPLQAGLIAAREANDGGPFAVAIVLPDDLSAEDRGYLCRR